MKKLVLMLVASLVIFATANSVHASDVRFKVQYGPVIQKNATGSWARSISYDAPVITLGEKGVELSTVGSYVYSENEGTEFQVLRTMMIAKKMIIFTPKMGKGNVFIGWDFGWYLQAGTGMWLIQNTVGEDTKNLAINFGTGVTFGDLYGGIFVDLVTVDGIEGAGDMWWLHSEFGVNF